uniref:Glycosyl transferase 64 domain-containing protein n=1 Tax=Phaeomonas parva TaxID=124430 RepID=A0A6U4D3B2_9STRA|mmetsp:Transcript_1447/g.3819  ORF Transcript_1447/g.3819 Transcript_1447/m.3819 type:complete len:471 (+) Transcript_1447:238-1650(+)
MIARPQQRQKLRQRLRLERWAAPFVWGVLVLYVVGSLLSTWRLPHHLEPSGVAKEHARASARGMRGVGSPGNPLLADILRRRGASQALCPAQYNASAPHSRGMFNLREDMARGAPECNADIPAMMCGETQFTIITMSYPGVDDAKLKFLGPQLERRAQWDIVAEVVMVWNGDAQNLYEREPYKKYFKDMPKFRVFEAKTNSLMNRYDPAIKPKTAAIMYVDDDGPFQLYEPTKVGFERWKQVSNRQVGSLGRHTPYLAQQTGSVEPSSGFNPFCNGDAVTYHFKSFPDFQSNMVLPSFSFLHRDYLCYIFSPAFRGVFDFVNDHITRPDDIAVSFIVSHISGLAPATYPKRFRRADTGRKMLLYQDAIFGGTGQNRTWIKHRSDALTWLATYFGSINPGSTSGWCEGRPEHVHAEPDKNKQNIKETCTPAYPTSPYEVWWMDGSCPTPGHGSGKEKEPIRPALLEPNPGE